MTKPNKQYEINKNTQDVKNSGDWNWWMEEIFKKELDTTDQTNFDKVVKEIKDKSKELETAEISYKGIAEIRDLKNNWATKNPDLFLENGTNQYDWWTKISAFYPATYKSNIYKGKVGGADLTITEQELILLLNRFCKAMEKIDETKFNKAYGDCSETTKTNSLDEVVKIAKALKDNKIPEKDIKGEELADKNKPANHTGLNRLEYTFSYQYVDENAIKKGEPDGTKFTFQSTTKLNEATVKGIVEWLADMVKDGKLKEKLVAELAKDTNKEFDKDIEKDVEVKILPAQSKSLTTKQLEEYGIRVADPSKTSLYLSETDISKVKTITVKDFKEWVELLISFLNNADDCAKLANSFKNDPVNALIDEIADTTNYTTNWELPETSLTEDELDAELIYRCAQNSILEIKNTIKEKTKEIEVKSKELDTYIGKIIDKKKNFLIDNKFDKLDKVKVNNVDEDNRKTWQELNNLKQTLYEIKYLQNEGDASQPFKFTDAAENTKYQNALNAIELRIRQIWDRLETGDDDGGKPATEITGIKNVWTIKSHYAKKLGATAGEIVNYVKEIWKLAENSALTELNEIFTWYDKKVKLSEGDIEIWNVIKKELRTPSPQTPPEKLTDWQTKLKALDKDLTDTEISDSFKTKWEALGKSATNKKFKKVAELEKLLKIVIDTTDTAKPKVRDDFLTILKSTDSKTAGTKINNLKVLMEEEPKKVIQLIKKYELDKMADSGEEKDKKKTQFLRRLAVKKGKKTTDTVKTLTDAELLEALYEEAVGDITLDTSKFYQEDLTEISTPIPSPNDNNQIEPTPWYAWGYYCIWWGILPVIAGSILAITFWEKITKWWNGPIEEEGTEETSENDEDI